jgi:DNA ligase-4
MSEFNEALSKNEEGIIIKKKDSIYKPDERCNDWVKMKCDYIDTLNDSLDLLILGGYYGEGKRRIQSGTCNNFNDHISSFLIGVVKSIDLINPKNSVILPISKVGTGYSIEELEMLRQKLKNSWKKYDPRMPAKLFGNWNPAISERPDVYIEDPSTSLIFEVKAAELV